LVAGFFAVASALAYDTMKQEQCTFPARFSRGGAYGPQASLRVNDVTIMSPSWIITIATDTDLYDSKRNRGDPSMHRNHLSPASPSDERSPSFPRSGCSRRRERSEEGQREQEAFIVRESRTSAQSRVSAYCSHKFADMMYFRPPSISDWRLMLLQFLRIGIQSEYNRQNGLACCC